MLTPRLIPRLAFAFVLGGLQGLLGWYMVKSGLIDQPHVSQYRLTAHLSLALIIYGYLLWLLLDLLFPQQESGGAQSGLKKAALFLFALVAITIVSGGFVAGLKAGFAYNTFPKMGDQWLPPAGWILQPGWRNLFENIATVQFDHRVLATLTLVSVLGFWVYAVRRPLPAMAKTGIHVLLLVVIAQVALGISTLLLHVPVALGVTHQAGALTLLTVTLFVSHQLSRAITASTDGRNHGKNTKVSSLRGLRNKPPGFRYQHRSTAWPSASSLDLIGYHRGTPLTVSPDRPLSARPDSATAGWH